MSAVLGIDLSSHAIDLVRLDETTNSAEWTRLPLTGRTAFDRCRQVQAVMPPTSFYDDVYLAAIERPKTRSFVSASALWPVFGAVLACMPTGLEVWDVAPTAWRAELGLAGNASKDECAEAVRLFMDENFHIGAPPWVQDAYDACAVAIYAREVNQRAIEASA